MLNPFSIRIMLKSILCMARLLTYTGVCGWKGGDNGRPYKKTFKIKSLYAHRVVEGGEGGQALMSWPQSVPAALPLFTKKINTSLTISL